MLDDLLCGWGLGSSSLVVLLLLLYFLLGSQMLFQCWLRFLVSVLMHILFLLQIWNCSRDEGITRHTD